MMWRCTAGVWWTVCCCDVRNCWCLLCISCDSWLQHDSYATRYVTLTSFWMSSAWTSALHHWPAVQAIDPAPKIRGGSRVRRGYYSPSPYIPKLFISYVKYVHLYVTVLGVHTVAKYAVHNMSKTRIIEKAEKTVDTHDCTVDCMSSLTATTGRDLQQTFTEDEPYKWTYLLTYALTHRKLFVCV